MFRKTIISIDGAAVKGYTVDGLDPRVYRGLRVVLVKRRGWSAYEATTGLSMMPSSWVGGFSNSDPSRRTPDTCESPVRPSTRDMGSCPKRFGV